MAAELEQDLASRADVAVASPGIERNAEPGIA